MPDAEHSFSEAAGGGGSYKNPMESVTIADKHLLAEFHLIHLMNISYMPLFLVTLLDFSQVSNTWILLFAMNLSHFHFNIWCMLKGFILPSLWLNQLITESAHFCSLILSADSTGVGSTSPWFWFHQTLIYAGYGFDVSYKLLCIIEVKFGEDLVQGPSSSSLALQTFLAITNILLSDLRRSFRILLNPAVHGDTANQKKLINIFQFLFMALGDRRIEKP